MKPSQLIRHVPASVWLVTAIRFCPAVVAVAAEAVVFALLVVAAPAFAATPMHVWEKLEVTLQAKQTFTNPFTDAQVWVDLKGPGFEKRCYGFWDGGNTFRVRVLANVPGKWTWQSGSQPADAGLNGEETSPDSNRSALV